MTKPHIAHVRQEADGSFALQSVEEHCLNVAEMARDFMYEGAACRGLKDLAYAAGLLHDFGKYRDAFQRYIRWASGCDPSAGPVPKAPHAIVGAIEAMRRYGGFAGEALAFGVSGHHRGLYDLPVMESRTKLSEAEAWCDECETRSSPLKQPELSSETDPYDHQLTIRMLFSSLVDADRLDTERYMSPATGRQRESIVRGYSTMEQLRQLLKERTDRFDSNTPVNRSRAHFLSCCRSHGRVSPPGIYTLSLPTGAGKTLSSMAWALEMAVRNHHDRIIYVIPYTSIITQTADTFRSIFGDKNILEHHSEVVIDETKDDAERKLSRLQFLSENWDAPIVLTTNVQFFESLFAANPSRCRKVHNIANSVIVLDEAQALPDGFLKPILSTIDSLAESFHCSVLLCTATQPVFGEDLRSEWDADEDRFYDPLPISGDVVPRKKEYFDPFDRVTYHLQPEELSSDELADRLSKSTSVLCVVNSRKDASLLYRTLIQREETNEEEVVHLSRMMCSAHLREQIALIKERLKKGLPTKVISTQLIEAGVDLDFPVVWRAHAGLGSIIQAGGRCNREGRLPGGGEVFVFTLKDGDGTFGSIARGVEATKETLYALGSDRTDPTDPEVIRCYYRQYFWRIPSFDSKGIEKLLDDDRCRFEEAERQFQLIDDRGAKSVLVPYNEESRRLSDTILHGGALSGRDFHRLQEYSVSLRERDYTTLLKQERIKEARGTDADDEIIAVLSDPGCYDPHAGVILNNHWLEETLLQVIEQEQEQE